MTTAPSRPYFHEAGAALEPRRLDPEARLDDRVHQLGEGAERADAAAIKRPHNTVDDDREAREHVPGEHAVLERRQIAIDDAEDVRDRNELALGEAQIGDGETTSATSLSVRLFRKKPTSANAMNAVEERQGRAPDHGRSAPAFVCRPRLGEPPGFGLCAAPARPRSPLASSGRGGHGREAHD